MNIPTDDGFDEAMRACHADAVSHLSARTRAQLQQRLRSTLTPATRHRSGWQLATAGMFAVVLASGLYWRYGGSTWAPTDPHVATIDVDDDRPLAVIDETPDLYLWLASDDAGRFASE
ncbi:MAG: hypothetical protein JWL98_809 [Xanthomonadaceae bacterium]|nr:hypothetical protein [Xanthomonadaceae bacterium]